MAVAGAGMIDPVMAGMAGTGMPPPVPDPGMMAGPDAELPEPELDPELEPELDDPELATEPEPLDPILAAVDSVLDIPGPDAIRLVYQMAVSSAKAKAKLTAMMDRLDARGYHDALATNPEARYAAELISARRELDALAAERRRLNLEAVKARESGKPASIYELQAESATAAMEQVAIGTLLFLALPTSTALGAI